MNDLLNNYNVQMSATLISYNLTKSLQNIIGTSYWSCIMPKQQPSKDKTMQVTGAAYCLNSSLKTMQITGAAYCLTGSLKTMQVTGATYCLNSTLKTKQITGVTFS